MLQDDPRPVLDEETLHMGRRDASGSDAASGARSMSAMEAGARLAG
jgi:hypothetical protein